LQKHRVWWGAAHIRILDAVTGVKYRKLETFTPEKSKISIAIFCYKSVDSRYV